MNWIRTAALALLRRANVGDVTISHHYAGTPFMLDAFRHRGYWYFGKRRERPTMALFADLVARGDYVIDVGGHIGYVAVYLAELVGPSGRVSVFEPGPGNLAYLTRNVAARPWIEIVRKAGADVEGTATLYTEELSGQNNSLLPDYEGFKSNLEAAAIGGVQTGSTVVETTTLDRFLAASPGRRPSLIKIDVEGSELAVLRGMPRSLESGSTALMVEVSENREAVYALLRTAGYAIFTEQREPVRDGGRATGNLFCVKPSDPRRALFPA